MSAKLKPPVTYCPDCEPSVTRYVFATARTPGPPCPACGRGQAIVLVTPEYWMHHLEVVEDLPVPVGHVDITVGFGGEE